ncbi:hypothetical protein TSUD_177510 [Trifolium subterraneum]|uniref:CCHC-type domain-containing protein n=1 Tax=Trifolium subterraneum TaxID=3900 RepID=A0A2Z6NY58_TRISU|nr:hypothetical protein TSUD_177510 [Trifolium subterraneum]
MAENSTFIQPSIPKFDGHYDHGAMLMENLLRSKELWSLIETRVTPAPENATAEQQRIAQENQLKDLKVKNYLFQAIDHTILETILNRNTSFDIWEALRTKYQGSTKVKQAQLQALRHEFEVLAMGESETVNGYFVRTLAIANRMTTHGERVELVTVVEKILRSMPERFNYVVCSIEQSTDVTTMSIDELHSSLLVQEGRMKIQKQSTDEQDLKMAGSGRGNGRGRGRNSTRGRGRGRTNKDLVQCYKCHKFGHYQNECPELENANFCEVDEEEMSLMDDTGFKYNNTKEEIWYLDSGCSNHMIGTREWMHDFNDKFTESVKLGNNSKMAVMGKGNVKMNIGGKLHVITDVYYIPAYTPQQNGVSERKNRTILDMVRSLISARNVPKRFWPGAVNWATYVKNRSPTHVVQDITLEEAWSGVKPSVHNFRIFGCVAHVHIPDVNRKKLDGKSIMCILLGVSEESKTYKLYNPSEKKIIISRDVVFEESKSWNWNKQETSSAKGQTIDIEDNDANDDTGQIEAKVTGSNTDNTESHDGNEANEDIQQDGHVSDSSDSEVLTPRTRRPPNYLRDYVTNQEQENEVDVMQNFALFSFKEDPNSYEEAVKHDVWKKAMESEIEVIKKNDTWELTDLPQGVKPIGVKWIYKPKYNEEGKIDKHKARLVAKGYAQRHGIDYNEIEAYFTKEQFTKCPHEHTLFVKNGEGDKILIVSLYVDDLIYTCNDSKMMEEFKSSMKEKFAMTDLGMMKYFLGVEVSQSPHGIFIHQHKYGSKILKSSQKDLEISKRHHELWNMYRNSNEKKVTLVRWTDSDYAGDYDDRKSTSGYVFSMGTDAISWSSKKQPIVNLSTTETEFVSAVSCACQGIWLRSILKQLKQEQHGSTIMYFDNNSSIKLSKNPVMHGRSKHIDVRYHFLRDLSKDEMIKLKHCRSEDQLVDIMTSL